LNDKISVLIVDDSAFMRKSLSIMLESDPSITVISTAKNGQEGYDLAKKLRPDIITLDIEMPVMDGLTALKKIMTDCPTSVLMVSSLTTEGAQDTIKALELGAIDFIPKELSYVSVNISKIKDDLIQKVKEIARQNSLKDRLRRLKLLNSNLTSEKRSTLIQKDIPIKGYKAIALGISTGGPLTLQKILPIAERINSLSKLEVKEAENEESLKPGVVYIAPGGFHMKLDKVGLNNIKINITREPADSLHRPSVDVMMNSVIDVFGKYTLVIIMTGMGKDGFEAVKKLKGLGGYCIAQNEETCVVYGMPKAIVDADLADLVLPADKIPEAINGIV